MHVWVSLTWALLGLGTADTHPVDPLTMQSEDVLPHALLGHSIFGS